MIALVVILFICTPAAASTKKIALGVPVYIGESDVDISSALKGCNVIAWWPEGADIMSTPPSTNLTIFPINTVSERIYHFNFSPDIFAGYTGTWRCGSKKPFEPVFVVYEPQIAIRVWDLDNDVDVTGQSIPWSTNVTYRIDTNMDTALKYLNRPNINPLDSFYTVTLTGSKGQGISQLFTGSAGSADTVILAIESHPYIAESPYYWKNGAAWDHAARNARGELLTPPGTYTFTLSQDLNNMQQLYAESGMTDTDGITVASGAVTFVEEVVPAAATTPAPVLTTPSSSEVTATSSGAATALPTSAPGPEKTTYTPLPAGIVVSALGLAVLFAAGINRKQ